MENSNLKQGINGNKLFKTFFILSFICGNFIINNLNAVNVFSVANGGWNSTLTWSNTSGGAAGAAVPIAGDDVFIELGFAVTLDVNTAATLNSISIDAGSNFITAGTFTVNATTINVNGTYNNASTGAITVTTMNVNAGANYIHGVNNGTIPTAIWNVSSNCNITGITTNAPAGLGQTFGNFNWNSLGQTTANIDISALTNVVGNFTCTSTGVGSINHANGVATALAVTGNFAINGGVLNGTIGGAGSNFILTILGNYTQTGGTFDFSTGLAFTDINLSGNFSQTAGTIIETGTATTNVINFVSAGIQTYTSGGAVSNQINYTVNSGATLQMAAAGTIISGDGTFTINSGATLGVRSPNGIVAAVGTMLGNIQTTTGRVFSSGANYIYNGTANQVAGTGLTQNTPSNVTLNNPGNSLSLTANTTISGGLTITAGTFNLNNFSTSVGSLVGIGVVTNSGAVPQLLTVGSDNASTTYSGIIQNGVSAISLTKLGTGTLTLSGVNTYTGVTSIDLGTISVATIGNGGIAGNLGQATNAAANLILGGGTLQYTGATAGSNRAFTLTNATTSTIEVTTNTFGFSGVIAATTGALIKSGAGALSLSGANLFTGGFTLNAGTVNINNASALGTIAGTFTINGGTINASSGVIGMVNYPKVINSSFIFTGTNNLGLGAGNTTISGNPTITTSANSLIFNGGTISPATQSITKIGAGTLSFGASIAGLNNVTISTGTFISTSNNLTITGTLTNNGTFNNNAGTVIYSGAGALAGASILTFNNLTLNGNTTLTPDPVVNATLILNEGASISSGAVTYSATGILRYNGTTGYTTTSAEFPAASGPLSVVINNSGNITLHASRTIASPGTLNLTSGRFILGANNFTITNAASGAIIAGSTFGSTNMVQADGVGQLIRATSGVVAYTYPVGDASGIVDYSPTTLTFTVNATPRNIGVNVINAAHPQVNNTPVQTDYFNRYWSLSNSNAAGTYTYSATFTYSASDLIGNESNVRANRYNGALWNQDAGSSSAGNVLSLTSQTQATFPITNGGTTEFTGRVNDGNTYTWNQPVTGVWTTAANWTPARTTPASSDILIFNTGTSTIATAVPTQTVGKILVNNNTTISLQSAVAQNLTISGGNGSDLTISTGSTLQINSGFVLTLRYTNSCTTDVSGTLTLAGAALNVYNTTNAVTTVSGSINSFGTITSTAVNLTFSSGANYRHNFTTSVGTIPTAAWNANSNCIIQGYTSGGGANFIPGGLNQTFGNFTWNCVSQTNAALLNGLLTNIIGNFTLSASGVAPQQVRLAGNTTQTINIGGNMTISAGFLSLSLNNGGNTTINVSGNYTQSAGTLEFAQGNATSLGNIFISGTFNFSGGTMQQTAAAATGGIGLITFNGLVLQNVTSSGSILNAIDFRVNNANGINLTGTISINNGASFFRTLGSLTGGTVSYNATGTTLIYEGTTAMTTGVEFPATNGPENVTVNTTNIISLSGARELPATGSFIELNGIFSLGANDLTINNTALAGLTNATPSASNMIAADGLGYLKRAIINAARNYRYYIGDISSTVEYTPIFLNFSANSVVRIVGARVQDATSVNINTPLPPVDFTSRTWLLSENGAGGTFTYKPTLTYVLADVNGTQNNFLISSFFAGSWTPFASTITSPSIVTTGNLTQASFILNGAELAARAPVIYWNGSVSSDWNDPNNWTPVGVPLATDNVDISFNIPNQCDLLGGAATINNLTLNGTGVLTLAAGTTLTVNGNFTYFNTASATFDCSSTFNIANTVFPQTIPAFNYGNLNVTGGVRILANAGIIGICGNYTPTAGALTTTGSTVEFNGAVAQFILIRATSFNNVTISNINANVSSAFNVTVNGGMQVNANARYEQTANTLTNSLGSISSIDGFLKGSNAIITNNGTLNINATAKYEHSRIGVGPGTIPTATWAVGSTCHIMGSSTGNQLLNCGQAFHHFIYDNDATANIRTNGLLTTINGDFTILQTGLAGARTFQVGLAAGNIINIAGNFIQSGGILDLVSGGGITGVRLQGDFSITGSGRIDKSGNTANWNFIKNTGTQTFTSTATGINTNDIDWRVGDGTTTNTLQLLSPFIMNNNGALIVFNNATLACGTNTVTTPTTLNGNFTLNAGGTLMMGSPNGITTAPTASGNIQTTLTRSFSATANYVYNGTAAQATGNGLPATVNNLTYINSSGATPAVTQTASTSVSGVLALTNGIVQLGVNNITAVATTSGAIAGGSSTAFIQTNGTGQLRRGITTTTFPTNYIFPIGTVANYTPASFNFTTNSDAKTLNVNAVAATHPQMNNPNPQVDFISNRYWKTDVSSSTGTYNYSSQFTFLPGDINGTVTNINLNRYDNTAANWTEDAGSSTAGNIISSGPLTQATGALTVTATAVAADWVGRIINGTYIWNGSVSSVYTAGNNWTPNVVGGPLSTDNIVINAPGTNQLNITGNISVYNFTFNGTGALNLASGSTFTVNGNLTSAGTPTANFNCNSTFNVAKATSQNIPSFNYGNLDLTGGPRVLSALGTIGICGAFTPSLFGNTVVASTVNYNGIAAQSISPTAFTFNNLTISNTAATVTSNVDLTVDGIATINSNATLSQTANQLIISATSTANVNGTLLVNGGTISNSGILNINANANLRLNTLSAISTNAPIYATTSNLIYNSSGTYNRGLEWSATSGAGYPGNVQISSSTFLDLGNGATASAKAMAGNLTIDDGSELSMNISPMSASLSVSGNITIGSAGTATLSLSAIAGGELFVGGNWLRNASSVFNHNNNKVTFNSLIGNQSITKTGGETFYDLSIQAAAGNVILSDNVNALNGLNLISGKLDLNGNTTTLGTTGINGTLVGGNVSSYIISGATASKFMRFTTTNATTYNFPVGDASNYTPISVQFYTSPMAANTQISVDVVPSAHPNLGTSTNYLSRYWQVEPVNMPNLITPYSVVYQWAAADEGTAPIPANLKPFKHNTQGWAAALGSGAIFEMGNGTVNPGTRTISWIGLWTFSDFTGNGNGTPLPISLLDFNAQIVLNNVELTWSTLTETNNDYFTIERSKNGVDFSSLAMISGAGNSNQLLNYKLIDEQPYEGVSYYRLKQTDFDGRYSYSEIKTVNLLGNQQQSNFSIYPNPSNLNGVYITFPNELNSAPVNVQLIDVFGKVVYAQNHYIKNIKTPLYISFDNLAIGIYTLQMLQSDLVILSSKLSIIK